MDTITIDILNPKAKALLKNLEDLNLIAIKKEKKKTFDETVAYIRNKSKAPISLEEISKEVESVRAERHGK